MNHYNIAGTGAVIVSAIAAIVMIAAVALFRPPIEPGPEFGICFFIPQGWIGTFEGIALNTLLIVIAVLVAFGLNKRYSFVKGTDGVLPVAMSILLASNPVNTVYIGSPVVMLLVNLVCLEIMMRSYHRANATTEMFAIATYLSLGSMVEYGFLPLIAVYPVMAIMGKSMHTKEILAYLMGLVAPYWVCLGLGVVGFDDFRWPEFLTVIPGSGSDTMLLVYVSLGLLALIGIMMILNNALLFYSGNIRTRTFNNDINLLGIVSAICMLVDLGNFQTYAATFCFASSVQISNFFAIRHIPYGRVWFWSLLSLFMVLYVLMLWG